jgi:hypothetical protein
MTDFYTYSLLNDSQYQELEATHDPSALRSLLCAQLQISYDNERKQKIIGDFLFYGYAFCKEQAFNSEKTCCFLSILCTLFFQDTESKSAANTIASSYEWFQATLKRHCVDMIPNSIKVFEELEARYILDYVMDSYYRHYRLYKYIFGNKIRLQIQQVLPQQVEIPGRVALSSLDAAIMKTE